MGKKTRHISVKVDDEFYARYHAYLNEKRIENSSEFLRQWIEKLLEEDAALEQPERKYFG